MNQADDDPSTDELIPLDESDWRGVHDNLCELLRLEPENSWHWLVMSIVDTRLGDHKAAINAAWKAIKTAPRTSVVASIVRTMISHSACEDEGCAVSAEPAQSTDSQSDVDTGDV